MIRIQTIYRMVAGIATFSALLLWNGVLMGQSTSIQVTADDLPVRNATVLVQQSDGTAPQISLESDASGLARFELADGDYTLVVFKRGYQTDTTFFIVASAEASPGATLRIELEPLSFSLEDVRIAAYRDGVEGRRTMRAVEGTAIYSGKKTEVVVPREILANKAANQARQVYAKVAGVNVWESDGGGLQLGIGGRGLSPDRTANFNTRQDGYDISADALGYPESYYTPPVDALERIEVVRGAASLQYGTQFGGLLNFVLRGAPEDGWDFVARQTAGSWGFLSSYTSLGYGSENLSAYGFFQYKRGEGWRPNAGFDQRTGFLSTEIQLAPGHRLGLSFTHMDYVNQQPGGLTDVAFEQDSRQTLRERNWFAVDWNVGYLGYEWRISPKTVFEIRNFGLIASKDALGFLGPSNRTDPGGPRDLLADRFRNYGNETRLLHRYEVLGQMQAFVAGIRYYRGHTTRQQGDAPDGAAPRFEFLHPEDLERFDYTFPSQNLSLFLEHVVRLNKRLSLTPGLRLEHIRTQSEGYYRQITEDLAGNILLDTSIQESLDRSRNFILTGLGVGWQLPGQTEIFANISQNYRAINFNDLRVTNPSFQVDPALEDERGFNVELGWRGKAADWLYLDAGVYGLFYQDRIGQVLLRDSLTERVFRLRTNVADSRALGLEIFAEADLLSALSQQARPASLSVFVNMALTHATYVRAQEPAVDNKLVELVPPVTLRSGLSWSRSGFKATAQFHYVHRHFTDATNAELTATGIAGEIPSYYVTDLSAQYSWKVFSLECGVTNLTDNRYFTRRATGYPGPGIIPAEGRGWFLTFGLQL